MVYARNPKQERSLLARQLRAQGQTWAEIAAEFRRRYGVSPRAALRMARGWSQRQAAEAWNERWPEPLRTAKHISSWETWPTSGHTPSFDTLDKLAQLYECDVADLLADLPGYRALDDAHSTTPDGTAGPAGSAGGIGTGGQVAAPAGLPGPAGPAPAPGPPGGGPGAPGAPDPGTGPTRGGDGRASGHPATDGPGGAAPGLPGRPPAPTTGPVAPAPAGSPGVPESVAMAGRATATNVDAATLEHLDHRLQAAAADLCHDAPAPIQQRVSLVQARVLALLSGHQSWRQTRHLYLLGARASVLLAWLATGTGEYAAADEHMWAAWRCAHQAEDDEARAWTCIAQARLAFWRDDPAASARHASRGLTLATTGGDRTFLTLLAARAWARQGFHDRGTEALRTWREQLDSAGDGGAGGGAGSGPSGTGRSAGDDGDSGSGSDGGDGRDTTAPADRGVPRLTPPQQHYLAGSTLLLAERSTEALDELTLSIEMFEAAPPAEHCFGAEMGARIDAAHAYVVQEDLDGAARVIEPLLDAGETPCLHPHVQRLEHLQRALRRPRFRGSRQAGDLDHRLDDRIATAHP